MKVTFIIRVIVFAGTLAMATASSAQLPKTDPGHNNPPPLGAILDLNGTPIPGGGNGTTTQTYTVDFVAKVTNTTITFAFRDDPAFISFSNASVIDLAVEGGGNLLLNGNFSGGLSPWTYSDQFGVQAGGVVSNSCAPAFATCWYDGAVQAYDAISQTIPTTIGDTYRISFSIAENCGCGSNFSRLSTNGDVTDTRGNGIDVTVYAQEGLPHAGQVAPPQSTSPGTTNILSFNSNANNVVQHILAFPADAVVPQGIDPTTLQLQSTNIFVSNSGQYPQYVVGTPFAPSHCFDRPGNTQSGGGSNDDCSLYEDQCFDNTHAPSEFNCPTTTTSFINVQDIFDPQAPKPPIAPNTTAVLIHFHPPDSNPNETWSATGTIPPASGTVNPVCTNAKGTTGSTPPVQCDIVNLTDFTLTGDQTTVTGKSKRNSMFISAYNVPMLESLVSANGKALNTPGVQGNGIVWFTTGSLNLDFKVNPGGCLFPSGVCPTPIPANNNFVPAPVAVELYGIDGAPTTTPAAPAADTSVVKTWDFNTNPVHLSDGVHVLQWKASDNVGILEQNIQLNPALGGTCPDGSAATSGSCYTTTLFNAQIGVDSVAPTVNITAPINTTYTLNQPVAAAYTCNDQAPSSGIALFYTAPPVAVGSNIDTSSVGSRSFTVTCTDVAGNITQKTVNYQVAYPNSLHLLLEIGSRLVGTGKNLTYGIFLLNFGPGSAFGVKLQDIVPAGTTFVSATFNEVAFACAWTGCAMPGSGTSCPLVGGTVMCNVGTLPSLSAVGVKLVVKVNAPPGSRISDTSTVTGLNPDPKTGNSISNTVYTRVTR
jgi:uncharacterized repeat protein (TIGR01451 family)